MFKIKNIRLKIRCDELGKELDIKKNEIERITKLNKELEMENGQLQKWKIDALAAFNKIKDEVQEDRRAIDKLSFENARLSQNQKNYLATIVKIKKLYKSEHEKVMHLVKIQKSSSDLVASNINISDSVETTENALKIQEAQKVQIENLKQQIVLNDTEYQKRIKNLEEELNLRNLDIKELVLKNNLSEAELQHMLEKIGSSEKSVSDTNQKLEVSLKTQVIQKEQISELLETIKINNNQYKDHVNELNEEKSRLIDQVDALSQQLDESRNILGVFELEVNSLQQQIIKKEKELSELQGLAFGREGTFVEDELKKKEQSLLYLIDSMNTFLIDLSNFFSDEANDFWEMKISELKEITSKDSV